MILKYFLNDLRAIMVLEWHILRDYWHIWTLLFAVSLSLAWYLNQKHP